MLTSNRIRIKIQRLISLAEKLSQSKNGFIDSCYKILDADSQLDQNFKINASCLNNDSVPIQLCIGTSKKGTSLRVIGDPGAYHDTMIQRYDSSMETLSKFLVKRKSQSIEPITKQTIQLLIPKESDQLKKYKQGFVWLAIKDDKPGIAFYLELAPLGYDKAWRSVINWLDQILPNPETALRLIHKLLPNCIVASAGLEGSNLENTRAKIYFRFRSGIDLDKLEIDLFSSPEIKNFIALASGQFDVDLSGFVMNIGFEIATGNLADVKIDLCGHCLRHEPNQWSSIVHEITNNYDLAPLDTSMLHTQEFEVAFIGLGLTPNYQARLNLYLKHGNTNATPENQEILAAQKDGIHYLQSIQNANGSWQDYNLPVGESSQWVTAYAGLALAQYGNKNGDAKVLESAQKAADWLNSDRSYSVGWGYNGWTGPDSDSTAMTIALMDELGYPVLKEDRSFLKHHWRDGDCLATYSEPGAWAEGHWDITPYGYLGMSETDQTQLKNQFIDALKDHQMENGFWRSYWWRNPFYSTYTTLEVIQRLGINEPAQEFELKSTSINVDNAFDLACLIGIECIRNPADKLVPDHIRALLGAQASDGRWHGANNLRVTDNFCYEPWKEPSGKYYTDQNAVISTATSIRVLSSIVMTSNAEGETRSHYCY